MSSSAQVSTVEIDLLSCLSNPFFCPLGPAGCVLGLRYHDITLCSTLICSGSIYSEPTF